VQSASLEQLSRSPVNTEPPDAEIAPPLLIMPPVAGAPPTPPAPPNVPEPPTAPPVPDEPPLAGVTTTLPPEPATPGEPPSGACNPKGVREQAKTKVMRRAMRFISTSFPRVVRDACRLHEMGPCGCSARKRLGAGACPRARRCIELRGSMPEKSCVRMAGDRRGCDLGGQGTPPLPSTRFPGSWAPSVSAGL
jgi:hypothetical protein